MFRRPAVRYGRTPQPETSYQKAAQIWDERIGSARVQAKNWRLMAFGSLILSAGLASGLVWQSTQGSIAPWVVEVDRLGQAQSVSPANPFYQPTDPQIAFHLARFMRRAQAGAASVVEEPLAKLAAIRRSGLTIAEPPALATPLKPPAR